MSEEQILISFYAVLHSKRYEKNIKNILKYKKFLEEIALPWVTEDKKYLREDTPLSINRKYNVFKKEIQENFLDIQKLLEKFSIRKEQLREYDNCPKHNGASALGKALINFIYNFENVNFNEKIDSRISELGGVQNYSKNLIINLDKELFN